MAAGMMMVRSNPNVSGWSLDSGYDDSKDAEYPMRMRHPVFFNPVFYLMRRKENVEYQCRGTDEEIKMILTMPGDALKASHNSIRILLSKHTQLRIKTKMTITSEELRRYAPNKRQCFYDSERRLRFYRHYTKNNCDAECLANFTKIECGCVKFSMPSK